LNRLERIAAHHINLGPVYMPYPERHLRIIRDKFHFKKTIEILKKTYAKTVLDIGCFDGWLDFLLINEGYKVTGIELMKSLADSAMRYAYKNAVDYIVHNGFFEDIKLVDTFDVVLCFETLEHVDLDKSVPLYIEKIDRLALKGVFISLPDQPQEQNFQHLWTPTEEIIRSLWGQKRNFKLEYKDYNDIHVPANWFIFYEI